MRRLVLFFGFVLAAFAFAANSADAAPVKLTKQQVQTVCDGGNTCTRSCGLEGENLCEFKCKGDKCSGSCLSCPGQGRTALFPGFYSKRVVKKAVKQAP
jgi:hypothetical protein